MKKLRAVTIISFFGDKTIHYVVWKNNDWYSKYLI